METTEVDLVAAEKVDPASAEVDFAEEKLRFGSNGGAGELRSGGGQVVEALNTARSS
jgi:hypothetical protein